MKDRLEYGPVPRGIYTALLAITPAVLILRPDVAMHYVLFLLFLGFGLRIVLEKSGLYRLWNDMGAGAQRRWDRKFMEERAREIEREEARKKYHRSRYRDPKLPKNW